MIKIGRTIISGDLILAPMDGFTDSAFRTICRQQGSAISISEFISTSGSLKRSKKTNPHIFFQEIERPFGFQLSGDDPHKILNAAQELQAMNPDFFDLNLGCPDKQVVSHGAGAALLNEPLRISQIIKLLTSQLPVPVSAKMRLGWDEKSRNYLDVSKLIEQSGAAFLSVHARTRVQAYSGIPDWEAIAEIKHALNIPVIGNGDVRTIQDIEQIKSKTGCDAVMIGRAAVGNPWIFARKNKSVLTVQEIIERLLEHLRFSMELYGDEHGIRAFRKHLRAYLHCPQCTHIDQSQLIRSTSFEFIKQTLISQFKF